jgi:hypothetical protein
MPWPGTARFRGADEADAIDHSPRFGQPGSRPYYAVRLPTAHGRLQEPTHDARHVSFAAKSYCSRCSRGTHRAPCAAWDYHPGAMTQCTLPVMLREQA